MTQRISWQDICWCGEDFGGSHYHCGRCFDPKPTSMMGHGLRFDDGEFGLTCDEANLGRTYMKGRFTVTDLDIHPERQNPAGVEVTG